MDTQIKTNRLRERVAIITGGGNGIGAATCRLFAKEGAKIVVADADDLAASKITKEIQEYGGQAIALKVDVTNKKEIRGTVQEVLEQWATIDILVNCAGMGTLGRFVDSDEGMWDRVIAVNLKGTMLFTHAVLPTMIDRNQGTIINISSIAGRMGGRMLAAYSASKAGVIGFTKALAREVAEYGVRVNDICPGTIDTDMFGNDAERNPQLQRQYLRGVAMNRMGMPEEVAAAALFLASDESSFITGHSLVVDGGTIMV